MLAGKVAVHDVADLEAFAYKALQSTLRNGKRKYLGPDLLEDLHSELIAIAWHLSLDYKPGTGISFSTYAYPILKLRVVDWYRKAFYGRARERPEVVSLELHANELDDLAYHDRAMGSSLATWNGDPSIRRSPDCVRVLTERASTRARALSLMDTPPSPRARRRARGAGPAELEHVEAA